MSNQSVVLPAGVPVNIMIYEKAKGSGVLITCIGSGTSDVPGYVTGESVPVAILGGFDLDIEHGDPTAGDKVKELLQASFGGETLHHTMQVVQLTAKSLGMPLS